MEEGRSDVMLLLTQVSLWSELGNLTWMLLLSARSSQVQNPQVLLEASEAENLKS